MVVVMTTADRENMLHNFLGDERPQETLEAIDLLVSAGATYEYPGYLQINITANTEMVMYYPDSESPDTFGRSYPVSLNEPVEPSIRNGVKGTEEVCLARTTVKEIPHLVKLLKETFSD